MSANRILKIQVLFIGITLFIKGISLFPFFIEQYYSNGIYKFIAVVERFLFGWIPFSFGDIIYSIAIVVLLFFLIRFFRQLWYVSFKLAFLIQSLKRLLTVALLLYILFNISWGLNYDRVGIAGQLGLKEAVFSKNDLDTIVQLLHSKVNSDAALVNIENRPAGYNAQQLFKQGIAAYDTAVRNFSFLQYRPPSVKSSMFSELLNYMGTQGYYNPFTGEAQVNTSIPVFIQPFIVVHEIAHQAGYGKESEASFVGWLVSRKSLNNSLRYATNLAMYQYAARELFWLDSNKIKEYDSLLHPLVKKNIAAEHAFYKKYEGRIEWLTSWIYGHYLKANNQPSGNRSYNEVVNWLIAYYKKYGAENM